MILEIEKRLAGKEDVNWDTSGTNQYDTYETTLGGEVIVHKMNASHIPILSTTRSNFSSGVTDVDTAINNLGGRVAVVEQGKLNGDIVKEITTSNLTSFEGSAAYNSGGGFYGVPKDLNGHALVLNFTGNDYPVNTGIILSGFMNGRICVSGNGATFNKVIGLANVFLFKNCDTDITVTSATFNAPNGFTTSNGISFIRAFADYTTRENQDANNISITGCTFSNSDAGQSSSTFALQTLHDTPLFITSCTFAGIQKFYTNGELYTTLDTLKAPLASPALTGTPTAPTAASGSDNTLIATTEFVVDAIDSSTIIGESDESYQQIALNSLYELGYAAWVSVYFTFPDGYGWLHLIGINPDEEEHILSSSAVWTGEEAGVVISGLVPANWGFKIEYDAEGGTTPTFESYAIVKLNPKR